MREIPLTGVMVRVAVPLSAQRWGGPLYRPQHYARDRDDD